MTRIRAALLLAAATLAPAGAAAAQFQPDLAALAAVPRQTLPDAAVRKALDEAPRKNRPYQFAVPVAAPLAVAAGTWSTSAAGNAVWRLRVQSPDAVSLGLSFAGLRLPAGALLRAYDPAGRLVHGPYTAANVSRAGLWLPLVEGDELVLEARMPAAVAGQFALGETRAYHGFREWSKAAGDPGVAGSCNVDVTCPAGTPWLTEAGSVAKITIGGQFACSGQLLNNVRQDQRRLFLTADHCGIEHSAGPAESVIFYFNYIGPCSDNGTDPEPAPTFQTAALLARDVQTDFSLLLITDASPLPAGAYFAGWDATGRGALSGAALHHPKADEKKISLFDTPVSPSTADIGSGCVIDAWQVQWSSGTTEEGSSGGGLWNDARRIIGVLSGGTADCSRPTGFDYFGRLDRAWTASTSTGGQLKAHLDPDNSCIAVVPGLDPATNPTDAPDIETGERRCQGEFSACSGGGGDGGGGLAWSLLALATALTLRVLRRSTRG